MEKNITYSAQHHRDAELKRLKHENEQLRRECDAIRKAAVAMPKARQRHKFIASVKEDYSVALLCKAMNVSRTGFYIHQRKQP